MRPHLNAPQYRAAREGRDEQQEQVEAILARMRSRPPLKGPQTYVRREGGRLVEYVR